MTAAVVRGVQRGVGRSPGGRVGLLVHVCRMPVAALDPRRAATREWLFQLLLWGLYFVIVVYQKYLRSERTGGAVDLQWADFAFALNYLVVILTINAVLLPRFFFKRRYWLFALFTALLVMGAILVEEFWLEPWFYPGSRRAASFRGFLPNLLEIGPTLIAFVGFKLAWDNQRQRRTVERLRHEQAESQLQLLRSQLHPHFLFNNLNNLYAYAQEQSPKTPEMILRLSAMLRYMLYESRGATVPLDHELDFLRDYIRLQELQLEDRGTVHFEVQGDTAGIHIAPLILIAFVENSFKHGADSGPDGIDVTVRISVETDRLDFFCSNTYTPTTTAGPDTGSGIGLANVRRRLELQYPERHELSVEPGAGRYVVRLALGL